ncbi:MAG: hypothetical protein DA408_04250 [Bacteroidetes bacterium]|nr:MAG: hypothetical protein DA408_04250 [Bacteroidota bacterium]
MLEPRKCGNNLPLKNFKLTGKSCRLVIGLWLLLLLGGLPLALTGQASPTPLPADCLLLRTAKSTDLPVFNRPALAFATAPEAAIQPPAYLSLSSITSSATPRQQPLAYCTADLAFFCRLEVKMEKAAKIPVRFRLGDVQRVDYLEGKMEGWRYGQGN